MASEIMLFLAERWRDPKQDKVKGKLVNERILLEKVLAASTDSTSKHVLGLISDADETVDNGTSNQFVEKIIKLDDVTAGNLYTILGKLMVKNPLKLKKSDIIIMNAIRLDLLRGLNYKPPAQEIELEDQ